MELTEETPGTQEAGMPVREVLQLGNPLLRQVAAQVEEPGSASVANLLDDMRDTLAHCRATTTYGRAIAAPQIGVLLRVVFLNLGELGELGEPWPLINPVIVERSPETMVVWDACLSFLCIFFQVRRNRWIKVRYQDVAGETHEIIADGDLSELLQHEIEHLDGILAVDRMTDVKTMCTREEFERRYRDGSPYGPPERLSVSGRDC
jgi:peptide deformylase